MKNLLRTLFLSTIVWHAASADDSVPKPYHFDSAREWTIVGSGVALGAIGLYYDARKTGYTSADFTHARRSDIPPIDRDYAGNYNASAAHRSNVWVAGSVLLPLTLIPSRTDQALTISTIYAETALLIAGSVSFAKGVVDRRRPYSYGTQVPDDVLYDVDTKRSFFSGHSATITGGAVLAATLFQDYYPQSGYIPWVWVGALGAAAYGSSLRIKAGMHFPSDVATGMFVGGSLAYFVPWLHKQPVLQPMTLYANADEVGMVWRWRLK